MTDNNVENARKISYWKLMTRRKQISTMVIKNDVINNKSIDVRQSTTAPTNTNAPAGNTNSSKQRYLSTATVFDLSSIGLSATLAVTIFIIIGYVAKYVAGPAIIFSVVIAAVLAFFAGSFYAELNCTIVAPSSPQKPPLVSSPSYASSVSAYPPSTISPTTDIVLPATSSSSSASSLVSMKLLLPSYIFTYMCIGEFVAFIIGWNLILEYVIGVALVSKGIASYVDMLVFDKIGLNITQVTPITVNPLEYFDFFAFFIPILIGAPLILILRRSIFLNLTSVLYALITVTIVLVAATLKANISNWNLWPQTVVVTENEENTGITFATDYDIYNSESVKETLGFFPFGLSGMWNGAAILLFSFIAFDAMVFSSNDRTAAGDFNEPSNLNGKRNAKTIIGNFQKTLPSSINSINGMLLICLFGVAVALTLIRPYYLLHNELPLPHLMKDIGWTWAVFVVLICGIISLFGSLYALMHAILRTIQTMALDGLVFKFFGGKFQSNQFRGEWQLQQQEQQKPVLGCLIFSLLAAILAALLDTKQLINLQSIGTVLMFLTLAMDVIMLRNSTNLNEVLNPDESMDNEGNRNAGEMKKQKISLISILLTIFCLVSIAFTIFLRCLQSNIFNLSMKWITVISISLIIVLIVIVFIMGLQPKRNSIFELKLSLNPLFPALNIFTCIYLLTMFDVTIWIRFIIWMLIGISLYIIGLKAQHHRQRRSGYGFNNGGFVSDHENIVTTVTDMEETTVSIDTVKLETETNFINITVTPTEEYKSVTPDVIPKHSNRKLSVISNQLQTPNERFDEDASIFAVAINRQAIDTIKTTESSEMVSMPVKSSAKENCGENQENTRSNYRTSSLKNFDEIVFVDDIKDICIEMKEPNGTAYFVEMEPQDRLEQVDALKEKNSEEVTAKKDEKTVLEMLDRVLGQTEKVGDEHRKSVHEATMNVENTVDDKDDVEVEQTTEVALIHTTSDSSGCDEDKQSTPQPLRSSKIELDAPSEPIKRENEGASKISEVPVKDEATAAPSESKPTPFFHIGTYKSLDESDSYKGFESDEQRKNFKEHLKRLLGHGVTHQASTEPRLRRSSSSVRRRPSLQKSKSTPDGINLVNGPKVSPPTRQLGTRKGNIPAAPKFDPLLFNTINSRFKIQRITNEPATAQCVENEFDKSFQRQNLNAANLQRAQRTEDLTKFSDEKATIPENTENNSVLSIRDRLERIFARGHPDQATRQSNPKPSALQVPNIKSEISGESIESNDEIVKIRGPQKPSDAVNKQKTIFNDVLKSINTDVRVSMNQSSSNKTEENGDKSASTAVKSHKPATLADAMKFLKRKQNKETGNCIERGRENDKEKTGKD